MADKGTDLFAGLGTGLLSVAGGIFGGEMQKGQDYEMQKRNQDFSWAMWRANNAYNHPGAVMGRWEDAGFNSKAVFMAGQMGQGTSNPVTAGGPGSSNVGASAVQGAQYPIQALQAYQNMRYVKGNADLVEMEVNAYKNINELLEKIPKGKGTSPGIIKQTIEAIGKLLPLLKKSGGGITINK
jgi:hypothetical protein